MALTFTDRKWHDETTGTVTFPGWSGSSRVTCRITDEALKAVFGAGSSDTDLLETFERCRASIEAAAIKKFSTSNDPLKLVLVIGDFETRAPAKTEPPAKSPDEIAAMMKRFRASGAGKPAGMGGSEALAAAAKTLAQGSADAPAMDEAPAKEDPTPSS